MSRLGLPAFPPYFPYLTIQNPRKTRVLKCRAVASHPQPCGDSNFWVDLASLCDILFADILHSQHHFYTTMASTTSKSSRVKAEAKLLLDKAINSLILSIEHFNRPFDQGRIEAVLILLDHSFEMFLKAAIVQRGGRIRNPREKQTIGFNDCVRTGFSNGAIKFLTENDVLLLQTINGLRDAAQHHLIDISEQHLYIQAQAGLSLFRKLLTEVFSKDLKEMLPARVLPLSTTPPTDLHTLFEVEIEDIKKLLSPGKRRRVQALAKLRALAIMESSVNGEYVQPSHNELTKLGAGLKKGSTWDQLFPGVASINITATGIGPSLDLKVSKSSGTPVVLVPEGTPGALVLGIKRVDDLAFYNLGRDQLAQKVGLTPNKTTAVIHHLRLQDDPECHKEVSIGKSKFHRYSQKAITRLQEEIKKGSVDQIWKTYWKTTKKRAKK